MKRIIIAFCTIALPFIFLISSPVFAVSLFTGCTHDSAGGTPVVCNETKPPAPNATVVNPIINDIKVAISVVSYIIGVTAIISLIISGLRFVLSGSDSNAVASARSAIVYSLIGIFIAVFAQVIVVSVLDNL